jgi:hypothetical protein
LKLPCGRVRRFKLRCSPPGRVGAERTGSDIVVPRHKRNEIVPMARMRRASSSAEPRAGCEGWARRVSDLRQRKRIELGCNLAQEPGAIAPCALVMFAFPFAVTPMVLGVGLATSAASLATRARVFACAALRCEGFARCGDRTERCDRSGVAAQPANILTRCIDSMPLSQRLWSRCGWRSAPGGLGARRRKA